jgi:K+ transporter
MDNKATIGNRISETVKATGLVFGDIGTSPIYTLSVIFLLTPPTYLSVIGILSLGLMFYGADDIQAKSIHLKMFALLKRVTLNFVHLLDLPYQKLHGVMTRIEI